MIGRLRAVAAAAVLVACAGVHATARADEAIDNMVRQMETKNQVGRTGSETCKGIVRIDWKTVVDESPPGPSIDFEVHNLTQHTIAVKFGYVAIAEDNEVYTKSAWPGVGTGHLNAGSAAYRFNSGAGMFSQSIAEGAPHPQIYDVKITPILVVPNIDVAPPNFPVGAYIDTWRDYPDRQQC